jgi:FSR family fosmidomycin resistance protein-like MFS transporter
MDRRALAALGTGHACADMCQGAVPALLPFLAAERGWSFAALGSLVMAASIGSSLVQPLFGLIADRVARPWLLAAGVVVAGIGVAAVGLLPGYLPTVAAIVVSGLGVAAFHPEGARLAGIASGEERGRGMSLFSVGGNAGFALGPILVTPLVLVFGLAGTVGLLVPALAAGALLAATLPRFERLRRETERRAAEPGARVAPADDVSAFTRLGVIVSLRSGVFFGLQTFAPAYLVVSLGASEGVGSAALSAMLAAGAAGTLVGGMLTDRVGAKAVVLWSHALLLPPLVVLPLSGTVVAVVLMAVLGFGVIASFAPSVVLGQAYLPSRPGLASGVTLGLAIGTGGVIAALLGVVADATGPETALWLLIVLVVPALALSAGLPGPRRQERRGPSRPPDHAPVAATLTRS